MYRREFIKSAALATGALAIPSLLESKSMLFKSIDKVGVQVYTVRDELQKDFAGTIEKLAAIGYDYLELFNYKNGKIFGNSVQALNAIFQQNGVVAKSLHVGTGIGENPTVQGTLTNGWEQTVEDAAALGLEYLVCAYLEAPQRITIAQYKEHAMLFNKSAEVAKKYGIQFAYHNHDFEFEPIDGQLPYDVLLQETDPDLVKMEMDLYWITRGGQDPVQYFKNHPGRFPLWHVKDMDKGQDKFFTEVGNGSIEWANIFKNGNRAGMKYFFVEQDSCREHTPLESLKISYDYLKKLQY